MVVLVMGLEVLTKHIGLDNEDKLGYDVGSFDGMTNEKSVGPLPENLLKKRIDTDMVGPVCGP